MKEQVSIVLIILSIWLFLGSLITVAIFGIDKYWVKPETEIQANDAFETFKKATKSTNYTLILPPDNGQVGQHLEVRENGELYWESPDFRYLIIEKNRDINWLNSEIKPLKVQLDLDKLNYLVTNPDESIHRVDRTNLLKRENYE